MAAGDTMKAPPNMMILASAGSGKTFALTNRFIALLAAGAAPEAIVALTFTRKAAGEFFDEILNKVSGAAESDPVARELAGHIGFRGLGRRAFADMLRRLVEAMPRLTLSTFDAFFARIVKTFPYELGLDGDFQILEDYAAHLERRRVLQRLFARSGARLDDAQRDFIEAFKRATFGADEKRLGAQLDAFLDRYQEVYLAAPDATVWGIPTRIWKDGSDWFVPGKRMEASLGQLHRLLAGRTDLTDKQRERWNVFFAEAGIWSPGAPLPKPVEYILKNALAVWSDVLRGAAEITIDRRKLALTPEECRALADCVRGIIGSEITRRLEMTAGIFQVLDGYDSVYRTLVRRAGKMTFADVQRILAPDGGAPHLSQSGSAATNRLLIDWRLDGRYDHWLLDEFQDTSHGQWSVIRNLIDEVMQDESGARTFFYVGDVKQAIYAWREGDSRLFREIFERYRAGGEHAIKEARLDKSWRSGTAVLEMVNRVFGQPDALCDLFPADAAERWNRDWANHETAHPHLTGHAAWLHAADADERFQRTRALLETIAPLQRGLSTAILVQKNDTANQLADFLRRTGGWPAIAESDLHIATDNPLTTTFLALLQAAAHPGDTLAYEHVMMSPWRALLRADGITSRDDLSRRLLECVHQHGFADTAELWLNRARQTLEPQDTFSPDRARQFIAAAQLYDETGDRIVADFIAFMHRHAIRDPDSAGVIRVMTIHKSKGLGFDVVILPDLEGDKLAKARTGLAVKKNAEREVQWILDLPPRIFCQPDPVLSDFLSEAESDACYDKLALLYVAMTRAKRGMYVITESKPTSQSHNFPKLLANTLGDSTIDVPIGDVPLPGGASFGDPRWFESIAGPPPPGAQPDQDAPESPPTTKRLHATQHRTALTPSHFTTGDVSGASLFAPVASAARTFGEEVHRLFGSVSWWDASEGEAWSEQQRRAGFSSAAIATARGCLDAPELADVFVAPDQRVVEVWTERAFEAVIDDAWVTGRFDRVLIEHDSAGLVVRVSVFDFKTDQIPAGETDWDGLARRHRAQMELYRRASALLTGVSRKQVVCALVFTSATDQSGARAAPVVLPFAEER